VYLLDYYWCNRVIEGLNSFDLIGLAGNTRRTINQPAWAFKNTDLLWDDREYLSGSVAHGESYPPSNISAYGPVRVRVKLLDGLFLASHSQTLINNKIFFDEKFGFHFYDLDLCRQFDIKGLSMGTWDISVIHRSEGSHLGFKSKDFLDSYRKYIDKWGN